MKKTLAALTSLALALPVCAVAPVTAADASDYRSSVISGHDNVAIPYDNSAFLASDKCIDPADATVKPVLRIDKKEVEASKAPGSVQTMNLTVSGANEKYASVGLHIYYDDRLTVEKSGKQYVNNEMDELMGTSRMTENGELFFAAFGMDNGGEDGVLASMKFKLPEDAKEGDLYPVCIGYQSSAATEDNFISSPVDTTGKLMQSYVFTQGIENGYIKVVEDSEPTSLPECFKDIYDSPEEYINKIKNGHENEEVPYNYIGIKEHYQGTSVEIWELAPKLSIDKLSLATNEAPGSTQKIRLNVSKLDGKYNELGVHIYYDTRLKVNEIVKPPKGASSEMEFHSSAVEPGEIYISAEGVGDRNPKNFGHDGAFAEISFTLPDDAEPGDLYPIGISYNDYTTDYVNDRYGLGIDMRQYIFSEGIENGYIKVTSDVLSTLRGDANLDNQVNIADAVLVMQVSTNPDKYAQGRSELSIKPQGEKNADVDGKTGLSNSDALLIQKFKLGLVETL